MSAGWVAAALAAAEAAEGIGLVDAAGRIRAEAHPGHEEHCIRSLNITHYDIKTASAIVGAVAAACLPELSRVQVLCESAVHACGGLTFAEQTAIAIAEHAALGSAAE